MSRIKKLPIYLITGFLGSGKTTFLHNIVSESGFPKESSALLINDAGPMNIDAKIFKGQADTVKALTGGCACCLVSKDLQREMRCFISDKKIQQVWIEASGVAEVEDLLDRLTEGELPQGSEVHRIIHLVDSANYGKSLFGKALQHAQWRWADVVILNKADLITDEQLLALKNKVKEVNPRALVLNGVRGVVNGSWLTGGERSQAKAGGMRVAHSVPVTSTWLPAHGPIKKSSLLSWLRTLAPEIYRVKGFITLAEKPSQICLVHQVGQEPEDLQIWPYESPKEELGLVLLGSKLDTESLAASWGKQF